MASLFCDTSWPLTLCCSDVIGSNDVTTFAMRHTSWQRFHATTTNLARLASESYHKFIVSFRNIDFNMTDGKNRGSRSPIAAVVALAAFLSRLGGPGPLRQAPAPRLKNPFRRQRKVNRCRPSYRLRLYLYHFVFGTVAPLNWCIFFQVSRILTANSLRHRRFMHSASRLAVHERNAG